LSQQGRVSDDLANFLLADHPAAADLETLLSASPLSEGAPMIVTPSATAPQRSPAEVDSPEPSAIVATIAPTWDDLVLPKKLIQQLQYLSRQAQARQAQADAPGLMVLLLGAGGTGKTTAAAILAADLQVPLSYVDLETLAPDEYPAVLTASPAENSSLLLVKQGEQWFGRKSQVEQTWLHQWWEWRQQVGLTRITTPRPDQIRPRWRQKFDAILTLPRPHAKARQQLWAQAFSPDIKTAKVDWAAIAQQLPLTGGEIHAIAQSIELDLRSRQRTTLTLSALRAAIALHQPHLAVPAATPADP